MTKPISETVQTYVKRPVEFQAIQLTLDSISDCIEFLGNDALNASTTNCSIHIKTLEGVTVANKGWFIIRGIKGEHYACEPEIFEKSNKLVDKNESTAHGYVVVNETTNQVVSQLFHALGNANAYRNRFNSYKGYRGQLATYEFSAKLSDMKRMLDKK